jgi:hypothetical protein
MANDAVLIIIIIPCICVSCFLCTCILKSVNKNNDTNARIQPVQEDPPRIQPVEEDPIEI